MLDERCCFEEPVTCEQVKEAKSLIKQLLTEIEIKTEQFKGLRKVSTTRIEQLRAEMLDYFKKAAELTGQLAKHRWIPVSERLPKGGEHVLCCDGKHVWVSLMMCKTNSWYHNRENDTVTHWKPIILPEK